MDSLPADGSLASQANALPPVTPKPHSAERYNLIAIGGRTALATALEAARFGARVVYVRQRASEAATCEHALAPRKALIAASLERSCAVRGDFAETMRLVERRTLDARREHSPEHYRSLGVETLEGQCRFSAPDVVEVDGRPLRFHRALVSTGTRPAPPTAINGIGEVGYLDCVSLFSLTQLPARVVVIGAGAIGCEIAQTLRRLGSGVQLVERAEALLPSEESYASEVVREQFEREGIKLYLGWKPTQAEKSGNAKGLILERNGERLKLFADEFVVAVGKRPDVESLNLSAADVNLGERGIAVDDYLRTSNPAIFAAAGACGLPSHPASTARLVVRNAFFWGRYRASRLYVPHCVDTNPQVARVGLTAAVAAERDTPIDSFRLELAEVERALLDGAAAGYAVVHTLRGSDRICGATIVATDAGALIGEISLAVNERLGLLALARAIHAPMTQGEVLNKLGARYGSRRITPRIANWLRKWLAWQRSGTA